MGVSPSRRARHKLANLRQQTSLAVYNREFTSTILDIDHIYEAEKLDRYIQGLQEYYSERIMD